MGYGVYRSRAGVIAGAVALQLISSACIALRLYTRYWRRQAVLISDWFVLMAWVCGTGLSIMEIYGVSRYAFATPLMSTNPKLQGLSERLLLLQHMEYAFVIIGVFSIGMVKLSVSLLYWHLFATVTIRRFLIVWIAIIVAWTLTFVLAELLECGAQPLKIFSTAADVKQYCPHIHEIGYALVGSDVATDLITLLIPLPIVVGMRLPTTQKLLVAATFLVGALAVGASTAKAYIFISSTLKLSHEDGGILLTAYSIWNLVEVHVCIVAACAMTLRPTLARLLPFDRFYSFLQSLVPSSRRGSERTEQLPSFVRPETSSDWRPSEPVSEKRPETEEDTRGQDLVFQTSALPEVV
ncbi:hypothetical protein BDV96DRAFT_640972 [Lophiotrema nucula]|uniref:Rhodopsin domain-containing protein n=1 Tax=Lophiotrema nucula TaxID=690887 RepID=A0A6A5ZTF4_9PLEO|nr:hypothetical protein BDV96DRAFT_640972 [Lophiotrema nucula]